MDDASTMEELHETMATYIEGNFEGKVKLVKLEKRVGLIVARMEGAKRATGEVLVFLDSHIEVNVNFLPPLLGQSIFQQNTSIIFTDYFQNRLR